MVILEIWREKKYKAKFIRNVDIHKKVLKTVEKLGKYFFFILIRCQTYLMKHCSLH